MNAGIDVTPGKTVSAVSGLRLSGLTLIVFVLHACASPAMLDSNATRDVLETGGTVIVSVQDKTPFTFTEDTNNTTYVEIVSLEDGKSYSVDSGSVGGLVGDPPDFKETGNATLKGRISVLSLPPGGYKIQTWYMYYGGGTLKPKSYDAKLKFQVEKGTVGYLGCYNFDVRARHAKQGLFKTWIVNTKSTRMNVINKVKRDMEVAIKKVPVLEGSKVQYIKVSR